MTTVNRRVAAYLPPEVDSAFVSFKIARNFATEDEPNQNDSKALIQMIIEFLRVNYSVAHSSSSDILSRVERLETQISGLLLLEDEVAQLRKLVDLQPPMTTAKSFDQKPLFESADRESGSMLPLGLTLLAQRLGKSSGTVSRYKDQPPRLLSWTREVDPDGIGWRYEASEKKFYPVLKK